ncbi:TetR/AcrR family transcriptional regulator [Sneathiella chinensis]|uniref:TetR family transcriptional regulator n=1 Tax=Sneathiella chinensis TaxID=349750 RepID=A0ABQ5U033_9PROT|nr:TetR/AcrR family transcriptional regulator [Sneathiella chinensis]GLQ05490.1 TetR family transcriptional regulator [Sneathiella chinensis]
MDMPRPAQRRDDLHAFKKQAILEAASHLFQQHGMEGTTMRAIAKEAGYSTGAPYAYYRSKEEIHADLLAASLARLLAALKDAQKKGADGPARIHRLGRGFLDYYGRNPADLSLGRYLLAPAPAATDGPPSPAGSRLTSRLLTLFGHMANTLHQETGVDAETAQTEALDAATYFLGTLLMAATGRAAIMGAQPQEMIDRYVKQMLQRLYQKKEQEQV